MTVSLEELLNMSPDEIWSHNERPSAEELRHKEQTYYEDVYEGMELPKYIYRPTPTHLFRWSAAIENFHRIHYDLDFGLNHDKNPASWCTVRGTERSAAILEGLDIAQGLALEGPVRAPGDAGARRCVDHVGRRNQQVQKRAAWASLSWI